MLTATNFLHSCLMFEQRQAGIAVIYCYLTEQYIYHAYCLETKLLKDLVSVEFDDLTDAIQYINDEFSSWELTSFDQGGCGSCHAK